MNISKLLVLSILFMASCMSTEMMRVKVVFSLDEDKGPVVSYTLKITQVIDIKEGQQHVIYNKIKNCKVKLLKEAGNVYALQALVENNAGKWIVKGRQSLDLSENSTRSVHFDLKKSKTVQTTGFIDVILMEGTE